MTLKINWEKTPNQIDEVTITSMFKQVFPGKDLTSYQIISDGCANLNFKIMVCNQDDPLILRVYIRDQTSAYKEQKLAKLIKQKIPIPQTYFLGEFAGYTFAITEYMRGITMRELLLNMPDENNDEVVGEAGKLVATISGFEFESSGFFDQDLNVVPSADGGLEFALKILQHQIAKSSLVPEQIELITNMLNKYGSFFPDKTYKSLVHGDYDPANILVDKIDGKWKITAILDWEFAFAGSWLCDVSKMLRYAHKMPSGFEHSFLKGIARSGLALPDNWRITTYLLNILFLLDCLVRSEPNERPNQYADIKELISHFANKLSESIII